jgi:CubicO group peptidase (beta-lactamase class C family)
MNKTGHILWVLGILTISAQAQTLQNGGQINNRVDYGRLRRIDTLLDQYVEKGWVNGFVTIIVRDNTIVQYKGYGYLDASTKKPMPKDALFRIASQTKAIVSAAAMILFEEGKFSLDEPVSDFIPAFKNPRVIESFNETDSSYTTVPAKREISFRDLLTHTSGLDYPGIGTPKMKAIYAKAGIPSGLGVIDEDLLERVNRLAKLPLVNNPGEKWTYGLSIDVLGCLIEVISRKNLSDFVTSRILQPLGMKDTYFNVPAAKASRLAAVYTEDSLHHVIRWTKKLTGIDPDYPLVTKHYFSGGAGMTSTAYDYAIFLQMMLNGGKYNGVQVLAPRTVQLMTSGQLNFPYGESNNFGLGFEITGERTAEKNLRNAGSFSWGGFFGTTYWADPKANLVVLIMTQQNPDSHGDFENKFEQLVYQSLR